VDGESAGVRGMRSHRPIDRLRPVQIQEGGMSTRELTKREAVMLPITGDTTREGALKFGVFIDGLCYASGSESSMVTVLTRLAARGYAARRPQ
jgi:hypothetical protein